LIARESALFKTTLIRQLPKPARFWNPRSAVAFGVALALLALIPSSLCAQNAPQSSLSVYWKAENLTVHAENAPLAQVIQRISHATGIRMDGTEKLQGIVTANFSGVPLRDGIARLLVEWDYAFTEGDPSSNLPRQPRLLILEPSRGNHAPPASVPSVQAAGPKVVLPGGVSRPRPPVPNAGSANFTSRDQRIAMMHDAAARGDLAGLTQGIRDTDPEVQKAAFEQFYALDPHGAAEELITATRSDDSNVALQALSLLSQSGVDHGVIQAAYAAELDSADPARKLYAVQLLSDIGEDALDALRQALADQDRTVRLSVVQNAARGDWGIPLLQQSLTDPDPQVRDMAQRLLQEETAPQEQDANEVVDEPPQSDQN
jgi:hypothetical protein